jgi:hypothetical protein
MHSIKNEKLVGNDLEGYTPKGPVFNLTRVLNDGKKKGCDCRDFFHEGKAKRMLTALAFYWAGEPWLDADEFSELADNVRAAYRAERLAREGSKNEVVETKVVLHGFNYRGNRVALIITTKRGSELEFCNRTLLSVRVVEQPDFDDACDDETAAEENGLWGRFVRACTSFFGRAA